MLAATTVVAAIAILPLTVFAQPAPDTSTKLVLTNDDGWAVAQIRAEYDALKSLGYQVVLSAPAVDKSGTGSSSAPAEPLNTPCQYNSCLNGSPPIGSNASDPYINYVNAFPVDAVRYGIQQLSPRFFGGPPDLVFSGVNVGNNLGSVINNSGTVGAATEAAREGIPSVAFSGASNSHVSYTTLVSEPSSSASVATRIYTTLAIKFINVLLANPAPLLPANVSLNVNFPPTDFCDEADIEFVFTRLLSDENAKDVELCDSSSLPDEESAIKSGCYATVSAFDARNKGDVPAGVQQMVYDKIRPIVTCLPEDSFDPYCS